MVTNSEFLTAVFGADAPWVHVSDFSYDPGDIPKDRHLAAWKGDYFSRYTIQPGTNQYFCVSTFYADPEGQARRRKALYRQTHCVVLDDVREKLSMTEVSKMPRPSWILETSPGSEQWGYILNEPCTDRSKVENLLDGLVANGLAPDGRDPGMKGVTRYVRLPEGSNHKASKLVDGLPFKCRILQWEPFNLFTIEQMAAPFSVDLDTPRRESRVDGAAAVSDHPLVNIPDIVHIKEERSNGRYDIRCPWVEDHTGGDDSGAAAFTNGDGTIGFKCHHGTCQNRTGRDLLRYIEQASPGFGARLKSWQLAREFASVSEVSFMGVTRPQPEEEVSFMGPAPMTTESVLKQLQGELLMINAKSPEGRNLAYRILKLTDELKVYERKEWHDFIRDQLSLSKAELKDHLGELRKEWYGEKVNNSDFFDSVMYVKELNQFYDWEERIFFTAEAFQNSFNHENNEARKVALEGGRVIKVSRLDYAPKKPRVYVEKGVKIGNTWSEASQDYGAQGDVSRWDAHFTALGLDKHKKHIKQFMAFTMRHPDIKINHAVLLGGREGIGKDFLLYPLAMALGDNCVQISGDELLRDFDDHLLCTKYLQINEAELGDHREAKAVSNKLKPLAAAPPDTLRVNQKGIKPIKIQNIVSVTMTTNSLMPLRLNGTSRRFFAVWSDLNVRDENDDMIPEWKTYWTDRWNWMKDQAGWRAVAYHLMYEVDLSDFNPGEAPPMTDFLREIKEASKSPMQQTIEVWIKKKHGNFACDLLTSSDMSDTLRNGGAFSPTDTYSEAKHFTPTKVGMMMREIGSYEQRDGYCHGMRVRIWVIRNSQHYDGLDSTELYKEYMRQIGKTRGEMKIRMVK